MTPELSRRLAKVVNDPLFLDNPSKFRFSFIDRVSSAETFADLTKEDQALILLTEGKPKRQK